VSSGISIEGRTPQRKSDTITAVVNTVDLDYFETAGIALTRGRDFTDSDRDGSLPVAIVNETMAARYWPGQDPVGKRFQLPGDKTYRQIVGVAKTANYQTLNEPPQPCVYLPLRQNFSDAMVLYVRTVRDPAGILSAVQREVRAIDPQLDVSDVRTGHKIIDQALWSAKMSVGLLGVFGLMALALASVGLYGILAYTVNRRRHEIGVRMSLGAGQSNVLWLVLRQGMSLVFVGIGIGLVVSLLVARGLARLLYGLSATDPLSLAGASLVLTAVAALACYLPARHASRVDPLVALREG
jgi:predicted permease